jgi:hypothetical protein
MPPAKTIELRVRALLTGDGIDKKQAEELLKLWRDNYKLCYGLAAKNCAGLVFLMLVFSLLATASLDELTVFGLKFKNLDTPLLIVYASCGYRRYRRSQGQVWKLDNGERDLMTATAASLLPHAAAA